jgi:uncharacterized membrane protein YdjX (TVP38/TMEM64 family)
MSSGEERTRMFSLRSVVTLILLIMLGATLLWASFNLNLPEPEEMREIILSYGWAGWLVFVGITAAIAITPIPITVPALVAGSLYGVIIGTLLSLSGVMIGSLIGYWLARLLGQRLTFQLLGRHSAIVQSYLSDAGFWAVFTVRVMPGLPYWPVNYGAGALGIGQYVFISATFLASIPGQISLVSLGAFAVNPSLFYGIIVVVSWGAVLTLTLISYRYWSPTKRDTGKSKE